MAATKPKPMIVLDALKPETWRDWERVLVRWKEEGHDGITLDGLAEITGRTARELRREIKARGTCGGCHCYVIGAPVFMLRYQPIMINYATVEYRIKWGNTAFLTDDNYSEHHPWKFWQQVRNIPGPTKWPGGERMVRRLKRVSRGVLSPWRRKVVGNAPGE